MRGLSDEPMPDTGRLEIIEFGRRCHESVPDRARLVAVWAWLGVSSCISDACDDLGDDCALLFFIEPKPLNSGMSSWTDGEDWEIDWSMAGDCEGAGDANASDAVEMLALAGIRRGVSALGVAGRGVFSGEMDLACSEG